MLLNEFVTTYAQQSGTSRPDCWKGSPPPSWGRWPRWPCSHTRRDMLSQSRRDS